MTYRKMGLEDVYCEKQTEHVISTGTTQDLNVNSGVPVYYSALKGQWLMLPLV